MKNSTIQYLNKTAGWARFGIAALLLVHMSYAVAGVANALFLRSVVNAAVAGDRALFWAAVARLAGLFVLQLALAAMRRWLDAAVRSGLENRFKARLFRALLTREFSAVSAVHSGEWMNRLTNDTTVVANGMTDILPGLAGMVVKLVSAAAMIIVLEPRFLWLVLPGGAVLLICGTLFRKQMKKLHKTIQEKNGRLRMFMQETLGSLLVVRAYAAEEQTAAEAEKRMEEHRAERLRRVRFSNAANLGFGFVMDGAAVLGALFCGYGILTGTMDYGSFTAVLNLIGQVQAPFANISGYLPKYYAMIASAERLLEIEMTAKEAEYAAMPIEEIKRCYKEELEGIGLSSVGFTYPKRSGEEKGMSPLPGKASLFIPKGSYAALIGESGCGKSTVLKLLMSLYDPSSGERYLLRDGKRVPLDSAWQRLFAYVPQGNHLMSGSIRQIVSYADPKAQQDEQRLRKALDIACAEFVFELEQGLDTVLGERGNGLSEGQMQRLAIARAIFSERPILMLDECTSALDEGTERRLLTNLRGIDRTVLIVTHRAAALEICDIHARFTETGIVIEKGADAAWN